jgi:hypothetical protein
MSTPTPAPGPTTRLDPASITAEVDAVLVTCGDGVELAVMAQALDELHQRLAVALATIDRV